MQHLNKPLLKHIHVILNGAGVAAHRSLDTAVGRARDRLNHVVLAAHVDIARRRAQVG